MREKRAWSAWSRFACCNPNDQPKHCTKSRQEVRKYCRHVCDCMLWMWKMSLFTSISLSIFVHWRNMVEFKRFRTALWILQSVFQWGNDDPSTRLPGVRMTLQVGCDIYLAIPCMKFMSFHVSLAFLVISTNHWVVLVENKIVVSSFFWNLRIETWSPWCTVFICKHDVHVCVSLY